MKQMSNPPFEKVVSETLSRARQFNDLPRITEAIRRAALMISLDPESVEKMFREVIERGVKL